LDNKVFVTDARCKHEDNSEVVSNIIDYVVKKELLAIQNVCYRLRSFAKVKRQINVLV